MQQDNTLSSPHHALSTAGVVSYARLLDSIIHVCIPLVVGSIIYLLPTSGPVRNFLPDGLWAYSFISFILITWDRTLNLFWLCGAALLFILFEVLQAQNIIAGTGDSIDVLCYFLFGTIALLINKPIQILTKTKSK